MLLSDEGASVIARLEYHGAHPGLHAHSHCERSGLENGPSSIADLVRVPGSAGSHRRVVAYTEQGFWQKSLVFFRMHEPKGPLI